MHAMLICLRRIGFNADPQASSAIARSGPFSMNRRLLFGLLALLVAQAAAKKPA
jgi:hypothetical protein